MIARRFLILDSVLFLGLSTIFLLPKTPQASPAGIAVKLPIWVGDWLGEDAEVTPRELEVLAKDTQFARKTYTSPAGDKIFVSIVLSGEDMTSSIHRPERCLPAQGWSVQSSSERAIAIDSSTSLATTRLSNARVIEGREKERLTIHNLTYYWFVGYTETTPSHLTRTMLDMRDRILRGYNQRWAYVTVAATVTEGIARPERSEAETDAMIERFIVRLIPKLQRPEPASVPAPGGSKI
jgi:EpsI family protein